MKILNSYLLINLIKRNFPIFYFKFIQKKIFKQFLISYKYFMEKSKTWKSSSQVNTRICCSSSTLWSITGYEWTVHAIVSLENNMFRVHRSSAHRCFATRSVGTSIAMVHPHFYLFQGFARR